MLAAARGAGRLAVRRPVVLIGFAAGRTGRTGRGPPCRPLSSYCPCPAARPAGRIGDCFSVGRPDRRPRPASSQHGRAGQCLISQSSINAANAAARPVTRSSFKNKYMSVSQLESAAVSQQAGRHTYCLSGRGGPHSSSHDSRQAVQAESAHSGWLRLLGR